MAAGNFALSVACGLLLAASTSLHAKVPSPTSGFSSVVCGAEHKDAATDEIVREVFQKKFQRLSEQKPETLAVPGVTSAEFIKRNSGLKFVVCDNRGSFDSLSVADVGVMFDVKLMGLLMAQARAIVAGATLFQEDQFRLHRALMTEYIKTGSKRSINPIKQVEQDIVSSGAKASDYHALLRNGEFHSREQNLFLVALNFLSLHERCHFALGHHAQIDEIRKKPEASQREPRRQLELDADRCVMAIINADEGGFAGSPIAYFGTLMVVTTQAIVSSFDAFPDTSSHPSSRARLVQAQSQVLQFVDLIRAANPERYVKYKATVEAAGRHMTSMLEIAESARKARVVGR